MAKRTPDIYDEAVAYFKEHPNEIAHAWNTPREHIYGFLFGFLNMERSKVTTLCGCPSQVKAGAPTADPEMTEKIRNIIGLPADSERIGVKNLMFFARAQRLADKTLKRPLPSQNWSTKNWPK